MNENQYNNFFNNIKEFKKKQYEQKQRGFNDFNPLTIVRKYNDEVYLHSAMIGAFLNPNAKHYQNSLFLEIFLQVIDIDFYIDISISKVYIEYKDIDLYITDGLNHIIIENKIWADDQACQIIKYINIIKEENSLNIDDSDIPIISNLYVLYLTPRDKKVSDEHEVKDGYIFFSGKNEKLLECSNRDMTKRLVPNGLKNYRVKYKKISYKSEIKKWLNNSLQEVRNIVNLSEVLKQYLEVVSMVNKEYKGNVMSLEEFILSKKEDEQENIIEVLDELVKEYINEKNKIKLNIFENFLVDDLINKFDNSDYYDYKVVKTGDFMRKFNGRIEIFKNNWKIRFIIRFEKDNMQNCYCAFLKTDDNIKLKEIRNKFPKLGYISDTEATVTSLKWLYLGEYKNLDDKIIEIQFKPEKISSFIFEIFKKMESDFRKKYAASFDEINLYVKDNCNHG